MKHLKLLLVLFLAMSGIGARAQIQHPDSIASWQRQINKEVWFPYIKHYRQGNAEAFNALYTSNARRVTSGLVFKGNLYREHIQRTFTKAAAKGIQRKIELYFDQRITTSDYSHETGYYRITTSVGGEKKAYVGYFQMVLLKQSGRWKIDQDWDSHTLMGKTLDAAILESLMPGLKPLGE